MLRSKGINAQYLPPLPFGHLPQIENQIWGRPDDNFFCPPILLAKWGDAPAKRGAGGRNV